MTVGVKARVRRDNAERTGEHRCGTVCYVSQFGWATVDFGNYREAFPVDEIEPMAEPHIEQADEVKQWVMEVAEG